MTLLWIIEVLLFFSSVHLGESASEWDCDFEGQCGYVYSSTGGQFKWQWTQSPEHRTLKPYTDHTYQQRGRGWFMTTKGNVTDTGTATMEAKTKLDGSPHCLTFYIYQAGLWLHSLYVKIGQTDNLVISTGENEESSSGHEVWQKIEVTIPQLKNPGRLNFVVKKDQEGYSIVAIDDITVTRGTCQPSKNPSCNFERGQCGWKSSDFQKVSEKNDVFDHTLATKYGHFMLAKSGDQARELISPVLNFTGPVCLRFFYIMMGSSLSNVIVWRYKNEVQSYSHAFGSDQKGRWIRGEASFDDLNTYQVLLKYFSSEVEGVYVGFDDLSFEPGLCPERMAYSFERGNLDPWSNGGKLKWSVQRANMSKYYPPVDFTSGTSQGHVAFVMGGGKGNSAVLYKYSEGLDSSCMSFYVYVTGTDPGSMSVYLVHDEKKKKVFFWTPASTERNRYVRVEFPHNLQSHAQFRTEIKVVMGSNGSWAIDDIYTFSSPICKGSGSTAPTTLTPPLPKDGYYDCTFDKDFCHWNNKGWTLIKGSDSIYTPEDHTYGDSRSLFLQLGKNAGFPSVLESPEIAIPMADNFGSMACFSFWYLLYSPTSQYITLTVSIKEKDKQFPAFATTDKTEKWTQAKIDVVKNVTFKIIIEGVSDDPLNDISIDDLMYTVTPCQRYSAINEGCEFELSDICGFTQDKYDDFDWEWHQGNSDPSFNDHDTNTKYGHMMLLQGAHRKVGDVANITSPQLPPMQGCLELWLYASKFSGKITVSTKLSFGTLQETILVKDLSVKYKWVKTLVPLRISDDSSVVFSGEVTSNKLSENYLALDGVKVLREDCDFSDIGACSFENAELCTWSFSDKGDFEGQIIKAMFVRDQIHPNVDNSLNDVAGHFLFFNPKSHYVGDLSIYESALYPKYAFQCLELAMSNAGMGFSIYVVDLAGTEKLVFRTYKSNEDWKNIAVPVGSDKDRYMIRFVAEVRYENNGGLSIDDIRFSPGHCVGGSRSRIEKTPAPVTERPVVTWPPPPKLPPSKYDCDFESTRYCKWKPDKDMRKSFVWIVASASDTKDHTHNDADGHVLTSTMIGQNGPALLTSPEIPKGKRCLIFWLRAPMLTGHELKIFMQVGNLRQTKYSASNWPTTNWQRVEVPMEYHKKYKVVFQASKRSDVLKRIFIDDIAFPAWHCHKDTLNFQTVRCDFEDGNGMCGFTQDQTDDYDWIVSSPSMELPMNVKPVQDHTLQAAEGHFVLSKLGTNKIFDSKARLISPPYNNKKGGSHCLSFYYHLNGQNVGHLNVYVAPDGRETDLMPSMLKWSRHYDVGADWQRGFVQINHIGNYHVVFESVKSSQDSIYGIDDIEIRKGICPSEDMCSFEDGACVWKYKGFLLVQPLYDRRDLKDYSVPPNDHTISSPSGHFFFLPIMSSKTKTMGWMYDKVRDSRNSSSCFTFWYHMYGNDVGTLRVIVNDADDKANSSMFKEALLWEFVGPTGDDKWHMAHVPISPIYTARPFQIILEAEPGSAQDGDVSIDDTAFLEHKCQLHPDNANPIKKISQELDCNFDQGDACNWLIQKDKEGGHHTFVVTDEDRSYLEIMDHTPHNVYSDYNSQGKFLLLSSLDNVKGTDGFMSSPIMPPTEGTNCLSFWYFVVGGDNGGTLSLLMDTGTSLEQKWADKSGTDYYEWLYESVNLHSDFESQLTFVGTTGETDLGSVAIDDIKVTHGPCHREGQCNFDTNTCGFQPMNNSDFNWEFIDFAQEYIFPLPANGYDGTWEGRYLASEFKGLKKGSKSLFKSKLYTPTQGECVSLFVDSGYNTEMEKDRELIKGTFSIKLVPVKGDGTNGPMETLYTMVIKREQWWKEIHFDILSKTHYRLILEAEVANPSGYVAIDGISFSSKPCPTNLSCDFEGDNTCGYTNAGDIKWHRARTGLMSSSLVRYERDHTTGTRNGHYMLYQFDKSAKPGYQIAKLNSYLQPSHNHGHCLTLWFAGYGTAILTVGIEGEDEIMVPLVQRSITFKKHSEYQDYDWDYLRFDLPAKQIFRLNILVYSKTPNTAVAIDDIESQFGTCEEIDKKKNTEKQKKPYYDPSKMVVDYTFEDKKFKIPLKRWTITNFAFKLNKEQLLPMDHTFGTVNGHYLYASKEGNSSKIKMAEFPATGKVCIDFYLYMNGDKSTTFQLSALNKTELVPYFIRQGDSSQDGWSHEMVELEGPIQQIFIEPVFGKYGDGFVAIDDFSIYRQHCPPTSQCQFEDDGWCGYTQENSNEVNWVIQQAGDNFSFGPLEDHTLGTGMGHYATFATYYEIEDDRTIKSSIVSPMYSANDAQCLQFFYSVYKFAETQPKVELFVYIRDESGKEIMLLNVTQEETEGWVKAMLPVMTERIAKLQFVFTAVLDKVEESIALDDINVLDQPCHELINCDFTTQSDLCGWQNEKSNLISWRQDKHKDGATLTIPANRDRSGLLIKTSILRSQLVPVFPVADYCLTFKYSLSGKVVHNLLVYFKTQSGREYLAKNLKAGKTAMSGTIFVSSRTTLYADSLSVLFKVNYGYEISDGKVKLFNVELHNSPCIEVEKEMNKAYICTDNSTIPSSKLCDFSEDCSDGSDEQECGDCSFEDGYCNWADVSNGESSFLVTSKFKNQGHLNTHAHYLLMKNADESAHQHADVVYTRYLGPSPVGCSVTFDYYAESHSRGQYSYIRYPIDYGTLNVMVEINGDETVIWQNPRGTSQDWHSVRVDIGHIRHRFKFHFEAEHYSYTYNVIAVDNIKLVGCHFPDKKEEPCSQQQFNCKSGGCVSMDRLCDLEVNCKDGSDEEDTLCASYIQDNFEYGTGYWSQSKSDDFDWVRFQGKSSDVKSGARRDHTFGTNKGHYLVIEGNGNHKEGDVARLEGPIFQPTKLNSCRISLYSHRSGGVGDGMLNIFKRTTRQGTMESVGHILVDDSHGWNKHEFVLNSKQVFQVVLEGIVGSYHTADIGVDDIVFTPGCVVTNSQPLPQGVAPTKKPSCEKDQFVCTSGNVICIQMSKKCDWAIDCDDGSDEESCGPCTFDSGMCGWNDVSDGKIMFQARNTSQARGVEPNTDHTNLKPSKGVYLRVASGYGDFISPARLLGPILKMTSPSCKMGLYFYKKGPTTGKITIGIQNPKNIYRDEDIVAVLPFNSLHYTSTWLRIQASFGKIPTGYQPFIEVASSSVNDDIVVAIDDVFFKDCAVDKVFDISSASCDFENGMCEWFNDDLDGEHWVRTSQSTPEDNTGPDRDHTTGSGYYIYVTSSNGEKATATLHSATLQWPKGTKQGCLSFWYLLFGYMVDSLDVFIVKGSNATESTLIYSKSQNQGNVWKQAFVTIESSDVFQIQFKATVSAILGDLALDDIQLSTQSCPTIPECDFEFGMCGFQSKSKRWKIVPGDWKDFQKSDHTLQENTSDERKKRLGHYLALDFTDSDGSPMVVESPLYPKVNSKMCLTMFMFGTSKSPHVYVYVKTKSKKSRLLDSKSALWPWTYTQQTFMPDDDYQIILEGNNLHNTKKPVDTLGFDDFRIDVGECPVLGSCDFEKSTCGYTTSVSDQIYPHWYRNSGYFITKDFGPPVDHTTKSGEGFYMIADSLLTKYSILTLDSPFLLATSSKHMCLSFWHYMRGNEQDKTKLNVVLNSPKLDQTLFSVDDWKGDQWHYQAVNISTDDHYKILFQLILGKNGGKDVAIDDILITDGNCTQRTLTPEVPKSYPPTKFDCNFDQGNPCKWTLDQGVNASLKVLTKSESPFVPEPYDHTHENEQGKSLMFRPTNHQLKPGEINRGRSYATATSPSLDQHNLSNGTCLKFWYMMKENAFGHIEVQLKKDEDKHDVLWRTPNGVHSVWFHVQVHVSSEIYITRNATDMKFVIKFYSSDSNYEEYKIDDISLNDGPCLDKLQHCDFEELGICGFIQDKTETLDWLRYPIKAPLITPKDHTYGTEFGHYMYLSTPKGENGVGRLMSPIVDAGSGKCFRFFFYTYATISETRLRVKSVSEEDNNLLLWEHSGYSGMSWRAAQVPIHFITPSRIVFEGLPGGHSNAFIGIDDMSLLDYECSKPASCDFERDLCLFSTVHGNAQFYWLRHMGPTSKYETGPSVDATTHTKYGHYMYIESSPPRINGDSTILQSEILPQTNGGCLSFSYHMNGSLVGHLHIYQHEEVKKDKANHLFSLNGNQGSKWNKMFINVTSQHPFFFAFEGVIGQAAHSDIAIDDIAYTEGLCSQHDQNSIFTCSDGTILDKSKVCDFVAQCNDAEDELFCGDCDFEQSNCGYVATGSNSYNFRRGKGFDIAKGSLGPDHTFGSKSGHMAFISGAPFWYSQKAYLTSALLQTPYQACSVQFYYKLMNRYGALKVELEFSDSSRVPIFTASRNDILGSWMKGVAQIGYIFEPFRIVFSGMKIRSDIPFAIDDIELRDCGPPLASNYSDRSLFKCNNGYQIQQKDLCNLADDCGDGSDEINCHNITACDFEKSFCTWSLLGSQEMGSWIRAKGFDPSYGAGPLRDHTTGSPSGHFIFLGHSPHHQKTNAKIISPVIEGIKEGEKCWLNIYYQMRGLSNGAILNVYLQTKHNGYTTKLFSKHNEQQNYWDRVILSLSSRYNFQIIIEGKHIGYKSHSEIGLDDIVFSSGCHMAGSSVTLPTPLSPLTTQTTPLNKCRFISQYQCGNGTCINKNMVCDFVKDCEDGSDEINCGSCDFEKGWCGWYKGSSGRIGLALSSPDVMGKLGPDKDTTKKSNKGHYLYATLSTGIKNLPVVLKSGPLRPISKNCYMSFNLFTNKGADSSVMQFTAVSKDEQIPVGFYSVKDYDIGWNQMTVMFDKVYSKLSDGWHLKISISYPEEFFPSPKGQWALDDFQFISCSLKSQKPVLDCDFDRDLCEWVQLKEDSFDWIRTKAPKSLVGPKLIYSDWNEDYLLAKSQGQRLNDVAIIESPRLPALKASRCLIFNYYMFGTQGEINVVEKSASGNIVIFRCIASSIPQWLKAYVPLNAGYSHFLEIQAKVSGENRDDIAIDNIEYKLYPCEQFQESQCTFENGDMCNWNNSKSPQWYIDVGKDHTTLTKYGSYIYTELSEENAGLKAVLRNRIGQPSDNGFYLSYCFTFWYFMIGGKSPKIEVYVNSSEFTNVATYPGPTENLWRRAAVDMYLSSGDSIFLMGGSLGGHGRIAIDDTDLQESGCSSSGSCTFYDGLCGYINAPSNKFNFVAEKINGYPHYAIARATANNKKGDTAVLISDPISHAGCLNFGIYLKSDVKSLGLTIQTLNVYIRELSSPQNRTLVRTVEIFARNSFSPSIETDVSSFHNFEVLFEVVYNGVKKEALSLYSVDLHPFICRTQPPATTTTKPSVAPVHPPSPFDCHFENNVCGWKILSSTNNEWKLVKGREAHMTYHVANFALWYDHTLDSVRGGFLESGSLYTTGDSNNVAYVISPKVDTKGSMCFKFWYYMLGTTKGELKLVLNTKTTLWKRVGPQGPQWNLASVHIRSAKQAVLSFETRVTGNTDGIIAIDDISAFYGKCPEKNGCDFENGACDFVTQLEGYAPWTLKTGIFLQKLIYPLNGDHTTGTSAGWAVAMTPGSMLDQRNGRLITTTFTANTVSCLTFWYYMKGSQELTLFVFKYFSNSPTSRLVLSIRGSQGPSWQRGAIDIQEFSSFFFTFEGHIEQNDKDAAIVIDDIKVIEGKCPNFASCDFEDNLCDWTNSESNKSNSDWVLFRGELLESLPWDHTTGTRHGGFLITEQTGQSSGYSAILVSPTLEHSTYYCLTLWAILGHNKLSVSTLDINGNSLNLFNSSHETATDPNPKANQWKPYRLSINPSSNKFRIFINGIGSDGHIALDDLAVYNQKCSTVSSILQRHQEFFCHSSGISFPISKKCDFIVDCPVNDEEMDCGYNCNFDDLKMTCKWTNNVKDVMDAGMWKIGNGSSLTTLHSSFTDYTLHNGHFLYSSQSGFSRSLLIYRSPLLQSSAAICELKFSYLRINRDATSDFVVRKVEKDIQTTLMSFKDYLDYNKPHWEDLVIPLGRNKVQFYVEISLTQTGSSSNSHDMLIDDIIFRNCGLPSKSSCTGPYQFECRNSVCISKEAMCNLQDDCGDGSDESETNCDKYEMSDFEDGSLGNWQQEIGTDEFDWHVYMPKDFPDHTLRSGYGHVASASNFADQRKKSDRAHIFSFAVAPNTYCTFSLKYMMDLDSKGQFNIYKRYSVNGDLFLIASPNPAGKYNWKTFRRIFFEHKPYQIVLEITAKGRKSISIDDTIFDKGCSKYTGIFPAVPLKPKQKPTPAVCTTAQFACRSGTCIPKSQVCDFVSQCSDNSDEEHCSQCDFDNGMCSWSDVSIGSSKWNTTSATSIGLKEDHTKSTTAKSHGILSIMKDSNLKFLNPAILKSGEIRATNPNCVLVFWVYVKNPSSAELEVSSQHIIDDNTDSYGSKYLLNSLPLRYITQEVWTKRESMIGYQKYGGQVIISVNKAEMDSNTVIALDDFSFRNCSMGIAEDECPLNEMQCGNKVCISANEKCDGHADCADNSDEKSCSEYDYCDFKYGDMCTLVLDHTSNAAWSMEVAPSSDLLPSFGHSNGRSDHFLVVKPSVDSHPLYARLKTPVIYTGINPVTPCHISFFYYQKTNVSQSIKVYTQLLEEGPLKLQWSNKYGTNGVWMKAMIPLVGKRPLRVVIEGVAGKNTAVAIDDVWFSRGCELADVDQLLPVSSQVRRQSYCKTGYFGCDGSKCYPDSYLCDGEAQCKDRSDEKNCGIPCNFEDGVCGWTAQTGDIFHNITTLSVENSNLSPDINPGSGKGHVLASLNDWRATVFRSPFYASSFGDCKFTFWYTPQEGFDIDVTIDKGFLTLKSLDSDIVKGFWTKRSIQMPSCVSNFHLLISAEAYNPNNPILFDDFKWENCPKRQYIFQCRDNEFLCKNNLQCVPFANICDLAFDCCDGSDEDSYLCYSYLRITFDWGMNHWIQEKDDEGDWDLSGQFFDHNTGLYNNGKFARFVTTDPRHKAKMSISMNPPLQNCHMRLWYASNADDNDSDTCATLNIYLLTGHTLTKLKSVKAFGNWKKIDVAIQTMHQYKIIIEGVGGLDYYADIFVDDISFTAGCDAGSPTPPPRFVPPTVTTITTMTTQSTQIKTPSPACSKKFQCRNTKSCIPLSLTCDFNLDCLDKTDEDFCHTLSMCDFTVDMCGWTSFSSVSGIDWVRDTAAGAKVGQAPTYDASFSKGKAGHFVYIHTTDTLTSQKSGMNIVLKSRIFNGAAASCLVKFSYFMQGSGVDLSLYINWRNFKDLIWKTKSVTNNKWQEVKVSIGRREGPFSLEFSRSIKTAYKGITAVDNIKFIMCAEAARTDICAPIENTFCCQNNANIPDINKCDGQDDCGDNSDETKADCQSYTINRFDSGFDQMRQLHHHDSVNWKIWSSPNTPAMGLPGIDHSTFTSEGKYAYAVGGKAGDSALLMSSSWVVSNPSIGHCKGTVYVMVPDSSAKISIGTRTHYTGPVDSWLQTVKTTSTKWTLVNFVIKKDKPFALVFKAEFSDAGSAVAIDDLIMSPNCKQYNKPLPNLNCPATQYECLSDSICIDRQKACDGKKDCKDGSDEYHCGHSTTTTTTKQSVKPIHGRTSETTQKHTAEKNVSSTSSGSWQMPVGVALGLLALLIIVVVVVIILKKKQYLPWLTSGRNTTPPAQDNGMENPLFEYGSASSSSADFKLDDVSGNNPNIFGESMKSSDDQKTAFDNPLYTDSAESSAA